MKIRIAVSALIICAIVFCGCSKSPLEKFAGSYTYKTSGTLRLAGKCSDTLSVFLEPEQGQMHVLSDSDRAIVTFNDILGNVDVLYGQVENGELCVKGDSPKVVRFGSVISTPVQVEVEGIGRKYGDMLLFDLNYTGSFEFLDVVYDIVGCDVHCVAQSN